MRKLVPLMIPIALGLPMLAGCSDDTPSASEWAAAQVKICTGLETGRQDAAKDLPQDAAPTVEQLMAFYAAFTPTFSAAVDEMKAVERPEGLDSEIDEFEAAMDATVAHFEKAGADRSAAEADLASDGESDVTKRLEDASKKVGLEECNG